nr:hypothetical protein [uncultured Capnocytophaga sp.]
MKIKCVLMEVVGAVGAVGTMGGVGTMGAVGVVGIMGVVGRFVGILGEDWEKFNHFL